MEKKISVLTNDIKNHPQIKQIVKRFGEKIKVALCNKSYNKMIALLTKETEHKVIVQMLQAYHDGDMKYLKLPQDKYLYNIDSLEKIPLFLNGLCFAFEFKDNFLLEKTTIFSAIQASRLKIFEQMQSSDFTKDFLQKIANTNKLRHKSKKILINAIKRDTSTYSGTYFDYADIFLHDVPVLKLDEIAWLSKILNKILFYSPLLHSDIISFENENRYTFENNKEKTMFYIFALLIPKLASTYPLEEWFAELDHKIYEPVFSYCLEKYFFNYVKYDYIYSKYENYVHHFKIIDSKIPQQLKTAISANDKKIGKLVKKYFTSRLEREIYNNNDFYFKSFIVPLSHYYDFFVLPLPNTKDNVILKKGFRSRIADGLYHLNSKVLENETKKDVV